MDINGEFRIPVERDRVWTALNDCEVLRQCIPGCKSFERQSASDYAALVQAQIGPIKAGFKTKLVLSKLNPPHSYTLSGGGMGGASGFGKGSADVTLTADGWETVLRYQAQVQIGGKLAQIGSRLVASATRKIADDFFSRFVALVSSEAGQQQSA